MKTLKGQRFFNEGMRLDASGEFLAAFQALERGAKTGNAECQLQLGYCYDTGRGVKVDAEQAIHWYKLAWNKGIISAAGNLGTVYRDRGDHISAIGWFDKAIEAGDDDSRLTLAEMYIHLAQRHLDIVSQANSFATPASRDTASKLLNKLAK